MIRPRLQKILALAAGALLLCSLMRSHAELSGAVDLSGGTAKANEQPQPESKQIAVTGIGANPESSEKQAVTDAVRQAVGAYIDANTLVQNEEVIKDRILSVSSGFVKDYRVVSPAKQREDGLYEVQILATVETTQMVNALKENNLLSGEVAGSDMWAQASTKVMNAQDAVAMLQAKMPEWIKSSVTITPLGEDGKPLIGKDGKPSTAPASVKEDAVTGKATLRWYLELGLDKKYYRETILPPLQKCLEAITGVVPEKIEERFRVTTPVLKAFSCHSEPLPSVTISKSYDMLYRGDPILFDSFSRSFDSYKAVVYREPKNSLRFVGLRYWDLSNTHQLAFAKIRLQDAEKNTLAISEVPAWQPFAITHCCRLEAVGPNIAKSQYVTGGYFFERFLVSPIVEIGIDLLKEIKSVEVNLEVPPFTLSLGK
jgi:hypothetical protein